MNKTIEILKRKEPFFWLNPYYTPFKDVIINAHKEQIEDATERLERFRSFIKIAFEETVSSDGLIESEIITINSFRDFMNDSYGRLNSSNVFLKDDAHLPISGSIKARGGIYAVLKFAEELAFDNGLIDSSLDYSQFASKRFFDFFSKYKLIVGSTGNLGLSIGIIGRKLGFRVEVHMSSDAKMWKKEKLRDIGAKVIEYNSDYSEAIKRGRELSKKDKYSHFIDDENSLDLFLGYSVAATRTKKQLDSMGIIPTIDKPLYVYLPCGVGGGPGGVAYGLKMIYGDVIKPIFAEPVNSPCMLLGISSGLHDKICVQDIGLTNRTQADGLAVGRASGFVGKTIENILFASYTVDDKTLFRLLNIMFFKENIYLEPSALAGSIGPWFAKNHYKFEDDAYHLIWATGGGMVPNHEREHHKDEGITGEKIRVRFIDSLNDKLVKIVMVVSTYKGKLVFCKHRVRKTYEIPAGHKELGEKPIEAARRELVEETSAIDYHIEPVCYYSVTDEYAENFGKIFVADITKISGNLEYEIEEIIFSNTVPDNTTYPYVVNKIIDEVKKRGFLNIK